MAAEFSAGPMEAEPGAGTTATAEFSEPGIADAEPMEGAEPEPTTWKRLVGVPVDVSLPPPFANVGFNDTLDGEAFRHCVGDTDESQL